jgi:hypothetical protein
MSKNKISTTIDLSLLSKVHGGAQVKTKVSGSIGHKKIGINGDYETDTTTSDRNDCITDNRDSVCRKSQGWLSKSPSKKDALDCVKNLNALCGEPAKSGD